MTREEAALRVKGDVVFRAQIEEGADGEDRVKVDRFVISGLGRIFVSLSPVWTRKGVETTGHPQRMQHHNLVFYSLTEVAAVARLADVLEKNRENNLARAKEDDRKLKLATAWLHLNKREAP